MDSGLGVFVSFLENGLEFVIFLFDVPTCRDTLVRVLPGLVVNVLLLLCLKALVLLLRCPPAFSMRLWNEREELLVLPHEFSDAL